MTDIDIQHDQDSATEARLQQQIAVLLGLARSEAIDRGDLAEALARITEAATEALATERSSVWIYNEDASGIVCLDLYEKSKGAHSSGIFLKATDFPAYFDYLREQRTLAADDAHRDPATFEFSAVYLTPLGINSMLDAPVRLGGRMVGVLCNEHVGPSRHWSLEEQYFAGNLADMIARAMQSAERRKTEDANTRLKHLDQLKSDFLSSVSHELRTPLTSIRGFASLVEREFERSFAPLAEEQSLRRKSDRIRDNLRIILKESDRLTRLINDVLDLAKIESGRIDWRDGVLSARQLIADAASATQGMLAQKPDIELRIEAAPDLPRILGDADRLQQVLVNLLNNAIKFTDAGTITLAASAEAGILHIEVRDTGIGFPPEDAELIFDKFQQARQGDTLTGRPGGTGLGLAICREIVSRHGGRIHARSTPGVGSVFVIELPTHDASAKVGAGNTAEGEAAEGDARQRTRVLVVDDDPAVRGYITQLLQEQGYDAVTAADGEAAIAAARTHVPDAITMDLAMPVMDGRTAIGRLRADPVLCHIPIMVISAIPGWESAGGDLAMSKPIDEQRFTENLRLLLADDRPDRAIDLLIVGADEREPGVLPAAINTQFRVQFCSLGELEQRIVSGFQGMIAIPVELLGRVDMHRLHALPDLKVMILPGARKDGQ